jgi:hypothetical protein
VKISVLFDEKFVAKVNSIDYFMQKQTFGPKWRNILKWKRKKRKNDIGCPEPIAIQLS